MPLEATLIDIIAHLRQGWFPSGCHPERSEGSLALPTEQCIVLPVLQELGWNIFDAPAIWPEFQTVKAAAPKFSSTYERQIK